MGSSHRNENWGSPMNDKRPPHQQHGYARQRDLNIETAGARGPRVAAGHLADREGGPLRP